MIKLWNNITGKVKPIYKFTLLGVAVLFITVFVTVNNKNILQTSDIAVSIKDFPIGTNIDYKIIAKGKVLKQGHEVLDGNNILNLPLPDNISSKDHDLLNYKIRIEAPKQDELSSAETLDLLLGLNQKNGNISLSGAGMGDFSNIFVRKNGDSGTSEKITSDWAGLFSSDSINSGANNEPIELAFQNIGLARDFNSLGSGKVEVFLDGFFGDNSGSSLTKVRVRYNWSLRKMTEELSAVMVAQTQAIGMFFDASIQLDVQRKHQELMARAYKDYHPSDQMCRIGTFIRSVAHSESKAELNKHALNKMLLNQYLSTPNNSAGHGSMINSIAELDGYTKYFCDPRDNGGALDALCKFKAAHPTVEELDHLNKDIDYTRTIASKLTIDVDFVDGDLVGTSDNDLEGDEADIVALAKNLYFPNIFELPDRETLESNLKPHYDSRSFAAKMSVAHSSFVNIMGMKSRAPVGQTTTTTKTSPAPAPFGTGVTNSPNPQQTPLLTERPAPTILAEDSGWAYMKAMLREFGIVDENGSGDTDDEIENILGERPSYYAQMEVLTKKIYQQPNFYTNLYDKPANVDRIGASIDAIALMNGRDRFESILRREMLTSLLIEEELAKHVENINSAIYQQMQKPQK